MANDESSITRRIPYANTFWTVATTLIALKILINFTLRDRVPVIAMFYYAVPNVLLGIAAGFLAWSGSRLGRSRQILILLQSCSLAALTFWVITDFRFKDVPTPPSESIRIVFWNVGRGQFARSDKIAEELLPFDADVIAISEATPDELQSVGYWRSRLPKYSAIPLDDGMVILVRGSATLRSEGGLDDRGEFRLADIEVRGNRFDVLLADVVSDPWKSRVPALKAIWQLMTRQSDKPTLVVGDFNTPPTSFCFDPWRGKWHRAWEASGRGYQPTWPQPLPVLPLDHVWGNRWIRFHRTTGGWTQCSDHRPVIVDFSLEVDATKIE